MPGINRNQEPGGNRRIEPLNGPLNEASSEGSSSESELQDLNGVLNGAFDESLIAGRDSGISSSNPSSTSSSARSGDSSSPTSSDRSSSPQEIQQPSISQSLSSSAAGVENPGRGAARRRTGYSQSARRGAEPYPDTRRPSIREQHAAARRRGARQIAEEERRLERIYHGILDAENAQPGSIPPLIGNLAQDWLDNRYLTPRSLNFNQTDEQRREDVQRRREAAERRLRIAEAERLISDYFRGAEPPENCRPGSDPSNRHNQDPPPPGMGGGFIPTR